MPLIPTVLPSRRARLLVALAIGIVVFALATALGRAQGNVGDFALQYAAGRAVLTGADPYQVAPRSWPWPYAYPYPAALVGALLSALPIVVAFALFVGTTFALLTYGLTRDGWFPLPALASGAAVAAISLGQWAPLLVATLLVAPAAPLWVVKPNLGLAAVAARPTRWRILGGLALLAVSVTLLPTWPASWLAAVGALAHVRSPLLMPGGFLLALAITRWRRPEARLLLALACVPQTVSIADTLPLLCLVPRTSRQALVLSMLSQVAAVASRWMVLEALSGRAPTPHELLAVDTAVTGPLLLLLTYLPCLVLVLRRPNEGEAPVWLELRIARLTSYLEERSATRLAGPRPTDAFPIDRP